MDLYRTGERGLEPVTSLPQGSAPELGDALVRGAGIELSAYDLFVVGRRETELSGAFGLVALDRAGNVVVVELAHGRVGSDVVTLALEDASNAAALTYDDLDARFESFRAERDEPTEDSLAAAHAAYFGREPLAPDAFNADQRVVLLGTEFSDEARSVARFLSDKDLPVWPVRFTAYDLGREGEYLLSFEAVGEEPPVAEPAETGEAEGAAAEPTEATTEDEETTAEDESAEATAATEAAEAESTAEEAENEAEEVQSEAEEAGQETGATDEVEPEPAPAVDTGQVLDEIRDGVVRRLAGTFDGNIEEIASVERGTGELLVRPDHPSYAGGVLRYRIEPDFGGADEDAVTFAVSIYGGSEAEKEQMRAILRQNEEAIEGELGYEVDDSYDRATRTHPFAAEQAAVDQAVVDSIVDEFDQLVSFLHPRVMGAWRETMDTVE